MATWNVNGWTEGNGDLRCNIISLMNIDVVIISETLLKDNDLIRIPDFTWFGFNRRGIYKKASKDSGGVGILVRDSLFRHFNVNIVEQSVQGIIGLELVNKATDYIVRLYSCYLPPEGSPWTNITVLYEHLLGELYLSSEADITIFGGDFNARVGDTADCISDIDELITRCVIDKVKSNYVDNLIDFLKETKM